MSILEFAKRELELIKSDEVYDGMMTKAVMTLLEVFCEEDHSGMSANICVQFFEKLARYETLSPLTGDDDEWFNPGIEDDGFLQNKRCPHVFKDSAGAYDIDAVIFRDSDGCCYTNRDSRKYITFPYTPQREYVDVPSEETTPAMRG